MSNKSNDKGNDKGNDSDSSVDIHGNLRDLIDYGSSEDEASNADNTIIHSNHPSARPMRQAAIIALQKMSVKSMEPVIHYPTVTRKVTPSNRKYNKCDEVPFIMEETDSEYEEEEDEQQ